MPWNRNDQALITLELEREYLLQMTDKIRALIESDGNKDVLRLHQMPSILDRASFDNDVELDIDSLTGNHLYLVMDVALKEHVERRKIIDEHHKRSMLARVFGNRTLRLAVAMGVFTATITPATGLIPAEDEAMATGIEHSLRFLSATLLALDGPEVIRDHFWDRQHTKQKRQLEEAILSDPLLCHQAFRVIYNSTRCTAMGRDTHENVEVRRKRIAKINEDMAHLANDPGGKPYTAEQAIGYAARFLLKRRHYIDLILSTDDPIARREIFMGMTGEIFQRDLDRFRKGIDNSRLRQLGTRAIALPAAWIFQGTASSLNEAATLSRDSGMAFAREVVEEPKDH
jgi:hypothetical protein